MGGGGSSAGAETRRKEQSLSFIPAFLLLLFFLLLWWRDPQSSYHYFSSPPLPQTGTKSSNNTGPGLHIPGSGWNLSRLLSAVTSEDKMTQEKKREIVMITAVNQANDWWIPGCGFALSSFTVMKTRSWRAQRINKYYIYKNPLWFSLFIHLFVLVFSTKSSHFAITNITNEKN